MICDAPFFLIKKMFSFLNTHKVTTEKSVYNKYVMTHDNESLLSVDFLSNLAA
jgi:hypothetical protein